MKAIIKRCVEQLGAFEETVDVKIIKEYGPMTLIEVLEGSAKGCTFPVDNSKIIK